MTLPEFDKKILFLDDDKERHNLFEAKVSKNGVKIHHVWSFDQAIKALTEFQFDEVFLDHDLGDFSGPLGYGGRPTEMTGTDVATWMSFEHNLPSSKRPKATTIHSWNPDGAKRMHRILRDAGFSSVVRHEFGFGLDEQLT